MWCWQSSWWWRASIQSARAPHLHPLRHRLHRLWCLHGFWHRGILVEKKTPGRPWIFWNAKITSISHEIMGNVNNCRHISQPSQKKIHWCCHVFCVRFLMLKRFCLRPVTWRENFLNRFSWICPSSHLLQQKIERGAEKGALYNLFSVKSPAQDQVFNFEDKMKKNRISFGGMKHFLAKADPSWKF